MDEKTVNIDNFIGVYDNYITKEDCEKAIKLYEQQNKFKNTVNRIGGEKAPILQKQDQQYFASHENIDVWWENLKPMIFNLEMLLNIMMKTQEQVKLTVIFLFSLQI